jgi:cell division protein FtsI (penicillin-binding protein 3)
VEAVVADRKGFQRRVRVIGGVMLTALAGVAARSFQLQVAQHESLAKLSRGQYLNDVKVPAARGVILDREGRPLAISVESPSVFANPGEVKDPRGTARKLAQILKLDLDATYQKLASERYFVWLSRQVSPEVAKAIDDAKLPGVGIAKEPRRFYPNTTIAANVIGFAGIESKGLEGIERQLDEALAGEPHVVAAMRDARHRTVLESSLDSEASDGADVRLSLDLTIQHAAQDALAQALREYDAQSGTAVVLDVATAEVLALATEPTFNPNAAQQISKSKMRNRPVTDVFEPGSAMKPLVIAAALDTGAVNKSDVFFCENGAMKVGSHTIHDIEKMGWMGLTGILQHSSNIGAAKVGEKLGRERLAQLFTSLSFGTRTGIELPGELPGLMRPTSTWSAIHVATMSYGHGIALTTLQLAAAYRALAADGIYRAPRLVKEVRYANGRTMKMSAPVERRVYKSSTVRMITPMLEAVVSDEGTGYLARVPGYRVAGKTGTSTKIDTVAGGYTNDRYSASFAGFLPAEAPRVVIVVALDEPMKMHHGGEVAAPVFARIGEVAMRAMGVVPSAVILDPKPPAKPTIPEATDAPVVDNTPDIAEVATSEGKVPSFIGLTAREAMDRYSDMQLHAELQLEGSGRVVRQSPAAGSQDDPNKRLHLVLTNQGEQP